MLDLLISMQKTIYLQKYIINILIVILRHLYVYMYMSYKSENCKYFKSFKS